MASTFEGSAVKGVATSHDRLVLSLSMLIATEVGAEVMLAISVAVVGLVLVVLIVLFTAVAIGVAAGWALTCASDAVLGKGGEIWL